MPAGARWRNGGIALALASIPFFYRPVVPVTMPGSKTAKLASGPEARLAILRAAYRGPDDIASILSYVNDPDPTTRSIAVQALGINRIVSDVEHAGPGRPSHYAASPVRARLRAALEDALHDPDEDVRAEAARALWRAPVTFGDHAAAAETLAAVLDRRRSAGDASDRAAWCAFNAAETRDGDALRGAILRWIRAGADSLERRRLWTSGALGRERTTLR
jgi:HEAT repeat protein